MEPVGRPRTSSIGTIAPWGARGEGKNFNECSDTSKRIRPKGDRYLPLRYNLFSSVLCTFQTPIAFAVIASALLDPLHAAIGVGCLVRIVLVDAGLPARSASPLFGIFRIDGGRENGGPAGGCGRCGSLGCSQSSWRGRRRCRCSIRPALALAEFIPFLISERAALPGRLIFRTAFLRRQCVRRRAHRKHGKSRHCDRA